MRYFFHWTTASIQLDKGKAIDAGGMPAFRKKMRQSSWNLILVVGGTGATWPPSGACFLHGVEGASFAWDVSPGWVEARVDSGSARARGQAGATASVRRIKRGSRARA